MYVRLFKTGCIRHPQLNAAWNIRVGAVDVQQTRVVSAQPDYLGDIAVIGEHSDPATFQIQQVP